MKSQVNALLLVMQGLLKDVQASYPALKGLDLDFERLSLYCQTRGLTLFTLDLPNLDAILLDGLENGRLQLTGPLSRRVSVRVKVPRLFSGLWLRVFDRDACLRQEVDITALFFLRQLSVIGKKLEKDCSPQRIQLTVRNFHNVERSLRLPTLEWGSNRITVRKISDRFHLWNALDQPNSCPFDVFFEADPKDRLSEGQEGQEEGSRRLLDKVQQVADLIIGSFELYDPIPLSEVWDSEGRGIGFKHGPGAVSERLKNHEKSWFPNWSDKLQGVYPYELAANAGSSDLPRPLNHEVPSRLICVPKTAKGPRLIASEPTAHQYCQQHLRFFMVEQLRRLFGSTFVDFHDQNKSGALVLDASKNRKLATVDLSDASDRLSCWTVERLFRSNPSLLVALHAARTRYLRDDVSKVPNFLRLRKFASQGTAVTFPVQSIAFLCIALGASIKGPVTWGNIRRLSSQVRVFGDDIIIPTHGYEPLVRIMNLLQLKVNMAKSYVRGKFRESCGTDGYDGYDVTPVKPKTLVADSPASCQAVVDTINNLFYKGYWNASDSLRATLPPHLQRGLRIVAINDAGFAGLSSFSGSDESHLAKRWNSRLHRDEVRVWSLSDHSRKRDRQGFPVLLDFLTSKHNFEHARIVSVYGESRKTRDRFLWEPFNTDARFTA